MKFKCKTPMWVSYRKGQVIDVDVEWEDIEYQGIIGPVPFFYKQCELFGGEKVRKKFYLFPDQFEPEEA